MLAPAGSPAPSPFSTPGTPVKTAPTAPATVAPTAPTATVAYFSMEVALADAIPTYSGGLGVLAGDTLRSAADLGLPVVGVTLLYRKGYFDQRLDGRGAQTEQPVSWRPEEHLEPLDAAVTVELEGRPVRVRAWRYVVRGVAGHGVPVYLLDTALAENTPWDQALTDSLYGGDGHYRLCQEVVLGVGGADMLRALGHGGPGGGEVVHHINEGHAALLTLRLLERQLEARGAAGARELREEDCDAVRRQAIFTTHTPVPAGHDRFPLDTVRQVLGHRRVALLDGVGVPQGGELNMTHLALRLTRFTNAVALRHREVSREMFPGHRVEAVTNGVHAATWAAEPFRELFDRHLPGWREDNAYLRYACALPMEEMREAHAQAKRLLVDEVARRTGVMLDPNAFLLGFARRATPYKRADLLFSDRERLRKIAWREGPLQIVYAGKAHPRDEWGKMMINRIYDAARELGDALRVVYLENYDTLLGRRLTSGVDVWLNTPQRPMEASGTSGMKAALNGVPSLSVLDGWWVEGHVEGVTGWAIGDDTAAPVDPSRDITDLYHKLERCILPLFYGRPYAWAEVMRQAIALNGSFFNTQRMVTQYARNAWFPAREAPAARQLEMAAD
jgi:glycogen phosphorylase